jgi:hypothetical protein
MFPMRKHWSDYLTKRNNEPRRAPRSQRAQRNRVGFIGALGGLGELGGSLLGGLKHAKIASMGVFNL